MNIDALHIGMKVRHPQYGAGTVKGLTEQTADLQFETGDTRTVAPGPSGLEPAEPRIAVTGLAQPLKQFVEEIVQGLVDKLNLREPETPVDQLGTRWHNGKMVLHPADPTLQTKEVPLEAFFHKIVLMRNNFRVLEQKLNAHARLTDADKVELQQYVTRCYGSLTTFNVLFKNKEDGFSGVSTD